MIIESYFEKFKKIINQNFTDKEEIKSVFMDVINLKIEFNQIEVKNNFLVIKKLNPQEKSEVFLKKELLLKKINSKKIKDITLV